MGELLKNIQVVHSRKRLLKSLTYDPIKVLSYNMYWEGTTGKDHDCKFLGAQGHGKTTICLKNIAKVIEEDDYDFIALQEATNWELLKNHSEKLSKMADPINRKIKIGSGGAKVDITIYHNRRWTLEEVHVRDMNTHNKNDIRPLLMAFFKEKILFINVHCSHNSSAIKNEIDHAIGSILSEDHNLKKKFKEYRIIMAGDFNADIKNKNGEFTVYGRRLYIHPKNLLTCCNTFALNTGLRTKHADHILDSKAVPTNIEIPTHEKLASDHAPVFAKLEP